ncbi:MAG: hypothetical protein FWG66_07000 [Spirochaetes bacterium]|nr:hypothetical protein [Spirochaetota bacterium]
MKTNSKTNTLAGITRYPKEGGQREKLEIAHLIEDLGLEGDRHAEGGDFQISLLSREEQQWMSAQSEAGLCFKRYKENLLFDSIAELAPGDKIKVGDATLQISDTDKQCFENCPLFSRKEKCILTGRQLFAKVVKSGKIKTGDEMKKEAP